MVGWTHGSTWGSKWEQHQGDTKTSEYSFIFVANFISKDASWEPFKGSCKWKNGW
jgi:hypothetical protein